MEFSAVSSPLKENHNPDEGSSLCMGPNKPPQPKPRRKRHRPKVIKEGKPKKTPKPATPKAAQPKENATGKRKYVRRKGLDKTPTPATQVTEEFTEEIPEAAKTPCRRTLSFGAGTKDQSSAGRENTTALLGKENGAVVQETNFGLACDLNTSVKHASSSSMSVPEDKHAPDTSSQSTCPGEKPKENPTGKKKYARRKALNKTSAPKEVTGELTTENMSELAKPPCKSSVNLDGGMEESSTVKDNATVHLSKENLVTKGTIPDLAYNVKISMKEASNSCMSLTEATQATNTSSKRKSRETKPKENTSAKRQYVKKSGLNKSSIPTEVSGDLPGKMIAESAKTSCRQTLNFDRGARDESSADRNNDATMHPCKETGTVMQEIDVGITYDIGTFMKRAAENSYMTFCDNVQTPSLSPSKTDLPGAKPKENLTGEKKYQRRKRLNKPPTCQTELTGAMMPESTEMQRRFSDFDMGTKDENSANREIFNVQIGSMVEETHIGLAYNQDTWMMQALNSYISLSEAAQAPCTYPSKGNPPVRKKRSKRTSTPTEMTGELTEPIRSESTILSCRMSLNFDKEGRDECNTCNESLASDQNITVNEILHNDISLSENTQTPSSCLPKSNLPGENLNDRNKNKRKSVATAQDGNVGNSQVSTISPQMVGCERNHSGAIECADNSSMNLIGAHYNGLPSYKSKFSIQFPNIQKKRRTEKGKTSNTHITSSVTTKNGIPLVFTPKVGQVHPYALVHPYVQVHPYASNYSSRMYGYGYNAAVFPIINESTENYIHSTQTFDEFKLSLRRVTERSQFPTQTCDYNSLTRVRNCIEPNYTANLLDFSDQQTIRDAEIPQTCVDSFVEDMPVSCAKNKRNRKKSVLSSSARPKTDDMRQCDKFELGNHHLALEKSSGISTIHMICVSIT